MKTYTQDEVDELLAAQSEQEWTVARQNGLEAGIAMATHYLMTEAGAAFTRGEDAEANQIRLLARIVGKLKP